MTEIDFDKYMDERGKLTLEGESFVRNGIDLLAEAAWRNSEAHGFHSEERSFGEEIALIHSEATEALEEARDGREFGEVHYTRKILVQAAPEDASSLWPKMAKVQVPAPQFNADGTMNKPEGIGAELADILVRVGDTARGREKLGERTIEKHRFNLSRPYKNGKQF